LCFRPPFNPKNFSLLATNYTNFHQKKREITVFSLLFNQKSFSF
jgi:hypothetical protein